MVLSNEAHVAELGLWALLIVPPARPTIEDPDDVHVLTNSLMTVMVLSALPSNTRSLLPRPLSLRSSLLSRGRPEWVEQHCASATCCPLSCQTECTAPGVCCPPLQMRVGIDGS